MVGFIDAHRDAYGVEPICEVLPIAPSLYYELKARVRDPERRPARARRDAGLCEHIGRVWRENREVSGVAIHRVGIQGSSFAFGSLRRDVTPGEGSLGTLEAAYE